MVPLSQEMLRDTFAPDILPPLRFWRQSAQVLEAGRPLRQHAVLRVAASTGRLIDKSSSPCLDSPHLAARYSSFRNRVTQVKQIPLRLCLFSTQAGNGMELSHAWSKVRLCVCLAGSKVFLWHIRIFRDAEEWIFGVARSNVQG